jgi:hypothetical protein
MARLRDSWCISLSVDQQPRKPQSESIARTPYDTMDNVPLGPFASFEDALRALEKHLHGVCHLTPDQR